MKNAVRVFFGGVLAVAFLIGSSSLAVMAAAGDNRGVLQIGTYTLSFFTDLDPTTGEWCEGYNHRTELQIKALASFIDSLDIEVLALQEVENAAALDKLLKYMPSGKYAYIISQQQGLCQRVAVLYQPKKVSLSYKGEIPLTLVGHSRLRDGLIVAGEALPDGFDFTMVIVHLKASFDSVSRAIRKQQLKKLGNWVENYFNDPSDDPDLILAGDFNEHLLSDTDAFALLNGDLGLVDITEDAPNKGCSPGNRHWNDPVDHIIISQDAQDEYAGTTVFDNYFTDSTLLSRESFSDHCVQWADFRISDQASSTNQAPPDISTVYMQALQSMGPVFDGRSFAQFSTLTRFCLLYPGPFDHPPIARDDAATANQGVPVTVNVLDNDSDPDEDQLTIQSVTDPAHGQARIVGSSIIYTSTSNYSGGEVFQYVVADGLGLTDTATLLVVVHGANVQIDYIHYDGAVSRTESDEYVAIKNSGNAPQDLSGWMLVDESDGGPEFRFPDSCIIQPGEVIRVYTNEIHPDWGGFSFGYGRAIWNNDLGQADTAALYNAKGEKVSERSY